MEPSTAVVTIGSAAVKEARGFLKIITGEIKR